MRYPQGGNVAYLQCLGNFRKSDAALPILRKRLAHPQPGDRRLAAALALQKLGEGKWTAWVKGDDSDFERMAASKDEEAKRLGNAAQSERRSAIDRSLDSLVGEARFWEAAKYDLVKMGTPVIIPLLDRAAARDSHVYYSTRGKGVLVEMGAAAVPTLIACMGKRGPIDLIIEALGEIKDARAIPALVETLANQNLIVWQGRYMGAYVHLGLVALSRMGVSGERAIERANQSPAVREMLQVLSSRRA